MSISYMRKLGESGLSKSSERQDPIISYVRFLQILKFRDLFFKNYLIYAPHFWNFVQKFQIRISKGGRCQNFTRGVTTFIKKKIALVINGEPQSNFGRSNFKLCRFQSMNFLPSHSFRTKFNLITNFRHKIFIEIYISLICVNLLYWLPA